MKVTLSKLAFIGCDKTEILLYLSRIYRNLGLKVAIVDLSLVQNIRYSLPNSSDKNQIEYRGIDFYLNIQTNKKLEDIEDANVLKYDIILMNFGFNIKLVNKIVNSDLIFLFTDFNKYNIEKSRIITNEISNFKNKSDLVKVYFNVVKGKVKEKFINHMIFKGSDINIIKSYLIEMDKKNCAVKYESQYNDIFKFKNISKEYESLLLDIIEESVDNSKKDKKRGYKLARKGK